MILPSIELECYGGSLDGQTVRVETGVECVHWHGEVYRVSRDDSGDRILRYAGLEHPVAA